MLIELFGENFGCFRDEFRLSMLATDIDGESERGVVHVKVKDDPEPLKLLRAAAIYGANASGKSTVIRAARALRQMIGSTSPSMSDSPILTYEPFAFGASRSKPTTLGLKVVLGGEVVDYEIRFDRRAVTFERLVKWGLDSPIVLFERNGQEVTGLWKEDDRFTLLTRDFGPNKLLLSLADRLTPSLAEGIAPGLRRLLGGTDAEPPVWPSSRRNELVKRIHGEPTLAGWLLQNLKAADLGIAEIRTDARNVMFPVERAVEGHSDKDEEGTVEVSKEERTFYYLSLLHTTAGEPATLAFSSESRGTQRLVDLAPLLFDLSHDDQGRAVFADELDTSLHPTLFTALIRQFNCELPHDSVRGQLIFAAHETSLLEGEARGAVLRRDQVYLTEKDADGSAKLFSIAEFKDRNVLNMRKRYLEGRYGAIPFVGRFAE